MAQTLHEMIAANVIAAATARYLRATWEFSNGPDAGSNTWCVEAQDAEPELASVLTNQVAVDSDELAWLKWFYENSDFGPADGDVRYLLANQFEEETGKVLPAEYRDEL